MTPANQSVLLAGFALLSVGPVARAQTTPPPAEDTVSIAVAAGPVKTFVPAHAFGAGIDGAEAGNAEKVFRPGNLAAMRALGFRSLTYRLRTELGIEAWHWNPRGAWSDPARRQGYWISDSRASTGPIAVSWGYRLPRRGSTIDQANNDGYSRIDDGDPRTFWKSNPYLDRHFTGETNDRHPQWVVVDLGQQRPVNTMRLQWGVPFASRYRVEYGVLPPEITERTSESAFEPGISWVPFPAGTVAGGRGGDVSLRLSATPIAARFLRVDLTESSGIAPRGSHDVRDGLGYALREIGVGQTDLHGRFRDYVRHGRSAVAQTVIYASSTDPWHRAQDRDPRVEQPGFDRVAASGLASGQPQLTPAPLIYDTPENAVAELRYLRARKIAVRQIELGEEPDGQYLSPEDYATLYVQWAHALHAVDPAVALGGPSFQTAVEGWVHWADAGGDTSYLRRFLKYLATHGRRADFAFFSFEWYPFDDLYRPVAEQVAAHAGLLDATIARLREEGLPSDIPWIISEYGYSAFATEAEETLPGALTNAETVAEFLTLGGDQAYLYGYEPGGLNLEKDMRGATWGDVLTLLADDDGNVAYRLPTWWAGHLLATVWTGDAHRPHDLFRAATTGSDGKPDPLLAAYPLRRPDGRWAVLLLNKDPNRSRRVRVTFGAESAAQALSGQREIWRYGRAQFAWKAAGAEGRPTRSLPPEHAILPQGSDSEPVTLPLFSISVLVGTRP